MVAVAQAQKPADSAPLTTAPVKEMSAAQNVTITGTVKCEKDAKGELKSVTVDENGTLLKVAAKDEAKVAAFDGQKVSVTGVVKGKTLSVVTIEAAK